MVSALQALIVGNLAGGGGAAPRKISTAPASLAILSSNSFVLCSSFWRSVASNWPSAVCSALSSAAKWARHQRSSRTNRRRQWCRAAASQQYLASFTTKGCLAIAGKRVAKRSIDFVGPATLLIVRAEARCARAQGHRSGGGSNGDLGNLLFSRHYFSLS